MIDVSPVHRREFFKKTKIHKNVVSVVHEKNISRQKSESDKSRLEITHTILDNLILNDILY